MDDFHKAKTGLTMSQAWLSSHSTARPEAGSSGGSYLSQTRVWVPLTSALPPSMCPLCHLGGQHCKASYMGKNVLGQSPQTLVKFSVSFGSLYCILQPFLKQSFTPESQANMATYFIHDSCAWAGQSQAPLYVCSAWCWLGFGSKNKQGKGYEKQRVILILCIWS